METKNTSQKVSNGRKQKIGKEKICRGLAFQNQSQGVKGHANKYFKQYNSLFIYLQIGVFKKKKNDYEPGK